MPPFSLDGGGGFAISPDSKELAFTENLDPEPAISTNADIFTLDLTNPAAKPVKVSTSPGGDFNPAYSPDGKYLAWRSQARAGYESDKFRLVLYDRAAKTIKDLLPDFDRWVDEFAWGPFSNEIYFAAGNHGEAPIYQFDLNAQRVVRLMGDNELSKGGEFSDLHPLTDSGPVIASRMSVERPAEVYRMDFGAAGMTDPDSAISGPTSSGRWTDRAHRRRNAARSPSPTSTTPSSPNSTSPHSNPSGSPPPTAPSSRASSSAPRPSTPPRNIPSNS